MNDPLPSASLEPATTPAGIPPRGLIVLIDGKPVATVPVDSFHSAARQLAQQSSPPFPLE
jgi:hypothetical protein